MRTQIEKIVTGKSGEIYTDCLQSVEYDLPHLFVDSLYKTYERKYSSSPSINGRIFEYAICETLAREGVVPFYYQAKFERVPNADFDVVLYNAKRPVVLTMKVSLRERYKQADLEGLALRNVYRQAESYLITLSESEAPGVEGKIRSGDIAGLDQCVLANTEDYTKLLRKLSRHDFSEAREVMPLTGFCFPG